MTKTELADLEQERRELRHNVVSALHELEVLANQLERKYKSIGDGGHDEFG